MLKKKQRLSRADFTNLLKKGKRLHSPYFSLLYMGAQETKCGLVVGKKIAKKATMRNKVRRQIYAIFGENLTVLSKVHCALLTRPNITSLTYFELKMEIEKLIKNLK
ncbi:TPA: ribonuclease P protein component [Patescibacteria group bacterium]|nr:MAG: Ribonuclease P protein component [Parcubacteria group bacterium GW2011_GWD2_42_14]HCC05560.1 ribonuclease P protein component [Patescibacteria group bacterium]